MAPHAAFGFEAKIVEKRLFIYGDSLSAGFPEYRPYAKALVEACEQANLGLGVTGCGLCGLTAEQLLVDVQSRGIQDRCGRSGVGLQKLLEDWTADDGAFDLALLLAGTNDILAGTKPVEIVRAVQGLHLACHERGVSTAVLSLPEFAGTYSQQRSMRMVNSQLEEWATARVKAAGGPPDTVLFVNAAEIIPCSPEARKTGLWDSDGIHFSEEGYQHFGKVLAWHVLKYFGKGPGEQPHFSEQTEVQVQRLLVLGDGIAAGEGADLTGAGGWAYQLADAVEDSMEVENRAMPGTTMQDWISMLDSDELQNAIALASVVVFSSSSSHQPLLASSNKETIAEAEMLWQEELAQLAMSLRARMSACSCLVMAGPLPTNSYTRQHLPALQRLQCFTSSLEGVDCTIDFLKSEALHMQGQLDPRLCDDQGRPNDTCHQEMFCCVDVASILALVDRS